MEKGRLRPAQIIGPVPIRHVSVAIDQGGHISEHVEREIVPVVLFVVSTRRQPPDGGVIARELAIVTGLAVLLSPVAWDHYWVLLFPAFLVANEETRGRPRARAVFWIAAFLSTALTPVTLGREIFLSVRERSPQTLAALVILVLLIVLTQHQRARAATMRT